MRLARIAALCVLAPPVFADPIWSSGRDARSPPRQFAAASHDGSSGANPSLRWLRDSIVELIFGKPAPALPARLPRRNNWAVYEDEVVVRFNLKEPHEETAIADAVDRLFKDVWAYGSQYVDIRMHKDDIAPFVSLLPGSLQSSYSILIPDLASLIFNSYPPKYLSDEDHLDLTEAYSPGPQLQAAGDNVFFEDYQPLPVIYQWMRLVEALFPSSVNIVNIGKSYEGRDILGLRVGSAATSGSPGGSPPRKPTIVVTGGLHAREWISSTTVNYVAWSFITHNQDDPIIGQFLKRFDLIFIPVLNPDGFEYTWEVDRLWRKNRQHTSFRFCRGIDLDRAFGYKWVGAGDPCSEFYGGEEPFEATEAQQFAEWAENMALNDTPIAGLIDLHSYAQQVLIPYSFSCEEDPPNLENLEELAAGLAKAIRLSSGKLYTVTSACEGAAFSDEKTTWPRVETGGGSAIDWFNHELRARYSYQIRLRDTGSYGFLLPKESIIPTGDEIFHAFRYLGDFLLGNDGIERPWDPYGLHESYLPDVSNGKDGDEEEGGVGEGEEDEVLFDWGELRK